MAMRERQGSGSFAVRSLLTVFLLQAAIAWVVSAPIQVAAVDPTPPGLGGLALAGAAVTVFGPLLMTFFLIRVSGVALTERTVRRSRLGYEEYVRRISVFVPLPPKLRTYPGWASSAAA